MFGEVLVPGFEGVFLVLVPLGEVAVVGAGGGQAVPAGGVVHADGDGGCGLGDGMIDDVAEEGVGQAGFE